jgi:hypothetical protein
MFGADFAQVGDQKIAQFHVSLQVEVPLLKFTSDALVRLIHLIAFYQNPTDRRIDSTRQGIFPQIARVGLIAFCNLRYFLARASLC